MALAAISRALGAIGRHGTGLLEVIFQFAFTVVGRVCYLVLQVFLARSLGPDGFGLYAIGWTVTGLVGTLAPIGLPQAAQRFHIGGRDALRSAPVRVVLVSGIGTMLLLFAAATPLAVHVFDERRAAAVIAAFAPSVPLLGLMLLLSSALRVSHAIVASAAIGAALFPLNFAATVAAFQVNVSPVMAAHMYNAALALVLIPVA